MKNIKIVLTVLIIAGFIACKSTMDKNVYKVTGTLYKDCSREPLANKKVSLLDPVVHGGAGITTGPTVFATDTTDANGNFEFNYLPDSYVTGLQFLLEGVAIMDGIPARKSLQTLDIYKTAKVELNVKLNVINPYTTNDTLVIGDLRTNAPLKVAGPFNSGVLYNVSYNIPLPNYTNNTRNDSVEIGYKVNPVNQRDYIFKSIMVRQCQPAEFEVDIN